MLRVGTVPTTEKLGRRDRVQLCRCGTAITVRDDRSVCVHAGFCGSLVTKGWMAISTPATRRCVRTSSR